MRSEPSGARSPVPLARQPEGQRRRALATTSEAAVEVLAVAGAFRARNTSRQVPSQSSPLTRSPCTSLPPSHSPRDGHRVSTIVFQEIVKRDTQLIPVPISAKHKTDAWGSPEYFVEPRNDFLQIA